MEPTPSTRPKGGGKRRRRSKEHEFMDAALDAFIRDQALGLWRDFLVYRAKPECDTASALAETGFFGDKGDYAALWMAHWRRAVLDATPPAAMDGDLFAAIETAVRNSVAEEREARKARGDRALEDQDDYNEFIRRSLNQLLLDDPGGGKGPA